MDCYEMEKRNGDSCARKLEHLQTVWGAFQKSAKVIKYPQNARDIRARVTGRGLRTVTEGKIIAEGLSSLFKKKGQD